MAAEDEIRNAMRSLTQEVHRTPVQDRTFDIVEDHTKELFQALDGLTKIQVLVGIPAETAGRNVTAGNPINNAMLGYIHETGSPLNNIHARPFLYPGVKNSQRDWMPRLAAAGRAALNNNSSEALRGFETAGEIAASAVKDRIAGGIPPPLKPATVAARRRRTPGSSYRRKAETPADAIPLIDTGQLLKSITFVLKGKP
jgi:hypothetical protein